MGNQNGTERSKTKRQSRMRPLPPDVTARNLATEKHRREALNNSFLDLARLVPTLAPARRLSKISIVNESVKHLREQRDMCISVAQDLRDLLAENHRLVSEINALRLQLGGPGAPSYMVKPVTEAMSQLMGVEDKVIEAFPAEFGGNWASEFAESQPEIGYGIVIDESETRLPLLNDISLPNEQTCQPQIPPQSELNMLPSEVSQTMPPPDVSSQQSLQSGPWDVTHTGSDHQANNNPWNMIQFMDSHCETLLSSYPGPFATIHPPMNNRTSADASDGLVEQLLSPPIDVVLRDAEHGVAAWNMMDPMI